MTLCQIFDDENKNAYILYTLNTYKYYMINNVDSYSYLNFNTWNIKINSSQDVYMDSIFLCIDTEYNDTFGHWVTESAIYLPFFQDLKLQYPNIKIHLQNKKKYKLLFTRKFNISDNDIVYELPQVNTCIFPLPITSLNNNSLSNDYISYFNTLYNRVNLDNTKNIHILVMPRGTLENYVNNNRFVNTSHIEECITRMQNTKILYTDILETLDEQLQIVSSSKYIIVNDGAAFFINGFFTNNSIIIVLGDNVCKQAQSFQKVKFILDRIKKTNTVIFIPYNQSNPYSFKFEDVQAYLN